MDLLLEVLVGLDMLQPVVVHLYGLIGTRVCHLEVRVQARLTELLLLKLSGQLHRLVSQFSRGDLRRLGNEFLHGHVEVVESVEVHLSFIELVLEV